MTDITLPKSVTMIDPGALDGLCPLNLHISDFAAWSKLYCKPREYTLYVNGKPLTGPLPDEGATAIAKQAYAKINSLTEITIPGHIQTIGQEAFADCANLTKVILKEGVTTIESLAFAGCTSLTTVVLPESLTATWILRLPKGLAEEAVAIYAVEHLADFQKSQTYESW